MMVFFAAVLPAVILFCGLVLDVGLLELKKLQMQSAADAAANGAVIEAERGTGNWPAIALADAGINGFTNGVNNVSINVGQMPTSGLYANRYDALQVTITQTVNTLFMGALNGGTSTISVTASGLLTPCTYFIGSGALQTYSFNQPTGALGGTSCPIYINSKATEGAYASLFGTGINITGASSSSNLSGYDYPPPYYNAPTLADPLASVTSPSFGGTCNYVGYTALLGVVTLNPGTYCGGITLSASTATLKPGLYIITGGSTWTSSNVTGSGVTLFFTKGLLLGYGQFIINSSTVNLTAPNDATNGGIPGVLVFADRNWVHTAAQDIQLTTSNVYGDGIWYMPNTGFSLYSCYTFQGTHYLGLVADNVLLNGTFFVPTNNYSYVTTGNPFRTKSYLVQ